MEEEIQDINETVHSLSEQLTNLSMQKITQNLNTTSSLVKDNDLGYESDFKSFWNTKYFKSLQENARKYLIHCNGEKKKIPRPQSVFLWENPNLVYLGHLQFYPKSLKKTSHFHRAFSSSWLFNKIKRGKKNLLVLLPKFRRKHLLSWFHNLRISSLVHPK